VVTLTHDPKLDDPALVETLKTPAFYIASLGGTRTHGKRLERLKSEGFDEKELLRINGPAGLDIGSVAPSEIAISILAELTAALHGRLIKSKNVSA
jgi:xanthine dehydrogenase accessory factor